MQEIIDDNFEFEVIQSSVPVMVDFWATWCPPCRRLTPIVEELAKEYQGRIKIVKMDVDDNPKTAQELNIASIPTMIFYKQGKEISRLNGLNSKSTISSLLDKLLSQPDKQENQGG